MRNTSRKRLPLSIGLAAALAVTFLGDPHYILPAAALWVMNLPGWWWRPAVWLASLALLVASDRRGERSARLPLGLPGVAGLALLWMWQAGGSETMGVTLITSVPFVGLTVLKVLDLSSKSPADATINDPVHAV